MSSDDEPRLPRELERKIFYTAALLNPSTIPILSRVARRVRIWVEPLLYRTLQFSNRPHHVSQLNAASTKPPEFLARAVRCLVLYARHDYNAAHGILSLCTGVTGLAVAPGPFVQKLLPVLSTMPIQQFAGYLSQITDVTKESPPEAIAADPLLRCLTRLDLFDSLSLPSGLAIMRILPSLPSLTHLAITHDYQVVSHIDAISSLPFLTHLGMRHPSGPLTTIRDWLEGILKTCRSLRILALLTFSHLDVAQASRDVPESVRDPRLVLSFYKSWFEGVLDGPNYWTVVEDFVARERRREVDASVFLAERA
ncbi:hypothetical protein C8F01DRAFT_1262317 [Mycena amicta]|nr:hypothetical protein C8F01DRAFT_1262317 [Mycena amicta]